MAAVSAAGQTGEVQGFSDRLGERLVVAQPSGALLEFLVFHPGLSSAPFFETEVKARLKRLSNFRTAAYARATRLQRDPIRGNRLTLVSAYTPGRRLADILTLARRGKLQPPLGAVLSLVRQLMTGAALLHDYAPDVFHGALGPERLVVAADGRLVITEYVIGTAVEHAVGEFGVARLWRECRLGTLADTSLARYGRRLDLLQIGLVTLSLLQGRQLSDGDFPGRLPDVLDAARENRPGEEAVPLGEPLRDWLGRLLCIDASSAFKTLIEAQKAFARLTEDEARYRVMPEALEAFLASCEEVATQAISLPPDSGSVPAASHTTTDVSEAVASEALVPAATGATTHLSELAPGDELVAAAAETITRRSDASSSEAAVVSPAAEQVPGPAVDLAPPQAVPPEAPTVAEPASSRARAAEPRAAAVAEKASVVRPPADRDAIAEMLAALPKPLETGSTADPFEPFPFAAADPVQAPETRWPPMPEWPSPARSEPPSPPESMTVTPGVGETVSSSAPAVPPVASETPAEVAAPQGWPQSLASTSAVPAPQAGTVEAFEAVTPAGEPRRDDSATVDRRPAVLSYDEVHRTSAPKRSKAPFIWAAAAIVVLAVAGVVGGPRIGSLLKGLGKPVETVRPPSGPTQPGGFKITTQPPGSRITIDGTDRGTAPLRVEDLAPGLHSIIVESEWGRLEEAVNVEAGKVVPLALATVGWIKVEAPVELEVSEEGRTFGFTRQPLMVPAGRHAFIFSNRSVAVRHRQFVQVPAGQTVKVALDLPQGMLNLTSDQPAQVILDGELIGDAPQVSVPAALGPHEVIFRSARYGDVSYSVNVTLSAPVGLTASFGARR